MADRLDWACDALLHYGVEFEDEAPELVTSDEVDYFEADDDLPLDDGWQEWFQLGHWPPIMEVA